jgi:type IV pilus assembly protein PilA
MAQLRICCDLSRENDNFRSCHFRGAQTAHTGSIEDLTKKPTNSFFPEKGAKLHAMEHGVLQPPPVNRISKARRGFTLVELAVVVVIVGILSVVAVVGYRRYMLNTKVTEGQAMVSAIRIAQEDYRAESGKYADIGPTFCPTGAGVGNAKFGWSPTCSGGTATWATLPVHPDGAVLFAYNTQAPTAWVAPNAFDTSWITWPASPTAPFYTVLAKCDLNSDGGNFTMLVGSSFDSQIFVKNAGD